MMRPGWTIGAELELADVERDTPLPGRSVWDRQDYTIVNSNGVANDPTGRVWRFGGEVNTEPTDSVEAQVEVIDRVLRACSPEPTVNYRCNFHVHLHVPGLASDVDAIKRLLRYATVHGPEAFALVDPLPRRPTFQEYPDEEERLGARRRWMRRSQSHHATLSATQLAEALAATTPGEIRAAHAAKDQHGRPQYHLAARCAVNARALWESPAQTVEFRHFCMSLHREELSNAMRWCVTFLEAALGDQPPPHTLCWPDARFPWQPLYDHWLETRYVASSRRYRSEEEIIQVIAKWRDDGTLEGRHPRPPRTPSVLFG